MSKMCTSQKRTFQSSINIDFTISDSQNSITIIFVKFLYLTGLFAVYNPKSIKVEIELYISKKDS